MCSRDRSIARKPLPATQQTESSHNIEAVYAWYQFVIVGDV
jgi:hypothetical protein